MLRIVDWQLVTDVSVQTMALVFKCLAVQVVLNFSIPRDFYFQYIFVYLQQSGATCHSLLHLLQMHFGFAKTIISVSNVILMNILPLFVSIVTSYNLFISTLKMCRSI